MSIATYDVLIVGSGIMGACAARVIRDARPDARILMIDAGPVLGEVPGQHLHDMPDGQLRMQYNKRVSSGIQGLYVGAEVTEDLGAAITDVEPGMYRLSTFGEESAAMPAAALAWNAGGMGIHWTAATPTPWGAEVPPFIDQDEWARDLATTSSVLRVNADPFGGSHLRETLTTALNEVFGARSAPGREVQPLPMAINEDDQGGMIRTGPNRIFPPIANVSDDGFDLRTGCQALALVTADGLVRGATIRDVASGSEHMLMAAQVIVCADAFRTPQLLFASGIRPAALGRYLNEHMFLSGRARVDPAAVELDPARLGKEPGGEWRHINFWLPHSDEAQPFNGQFSGTVRVSGDGQPVEASAGISLYVPTEVRAENRVEFDERHLDSAEMPRMRIVFDYSEKDRRLLDEARRVQATAGRRLGAFDAETDAQLLPPGASLHMTGTVRMGPTDDDTSVCDPTGRVWGYDNLYVAGCGVVPTALVGNSTLSGAVTAVRAARAVAEGLGQ